MKFQLTLSNLLLLTAIVALAVLLWLQRSENRWYEQRLPALKDAARELYVKDPSLFHAVRKHPQWYSEKIWKIHVPEEGSFKLCLATDEIPRGLGPGRFGKFPRAENSVELGAGVYDIELRVDRGEVSKIEVLVDEESAMFATKDAGWTYGTSSSSSSGDVSTCESFSLGTPVCLYDMKNQKNSKPGVAPDNTCNGVLLWIVSE